MTSEPPSKTTKSTKGADIALRLLDVSARVIKLTDSLPKTVAGRHVAAQLLRCGTAPGAHFEEARAAESRADFVHKIALALKELREAHFWLRLVARSGMLAPARLDALMTETDELCRILGKSKITARAESLRVAKQP